MKRMNVKKLFGSAIKIIIATVVFVFLGMKSIDFFLFTTPADKWFYAYLGFGLTGGGVIAYLIIFLWDADSALKKMVAIVMLGVCIIGELATAGFGLQIDTWEKTGISMLESDFQAMVLAVQLLGFAHAAALVAYVAGDRIAEALGDEDGDRIPNFIDHADNRKQNNQPIPVWGTPFEKKQLTAPAAQPAPSAPVEVRKCADCGKRITAGFFCDLNCEDKYNRRVYPHLYKPVEPYAPPAPEAAPTVRFIFTPSADKKIGTFVVRHGVDYQVMSNDHLYGGGQDLGLFSDSEYAAMKLQANASPKL